MTNKWTEKAHTTIYCTYCGTAAEKHKRKAGYSEETGEPLFMVVDVCPNHGDVCGIINPLVDGFPYLDGKLVFPCPNKHLHKRIMYDFEEDEIKDIEFVEAE